MTEIMTPDGVVAWIAALLPGRGGPLHVDYHLDKLAADGARYLRRDRMSVIFSGAVEQDGKRWLHVSCAFANKLPTFDDLRQIKEVFLGTEAYAVQVFPPQKHYVNIHPYCLHLFACIDGYPLPEFTRGGKSL
jgi:hypothetical protein